MKKYSSVLIVLFLLVGYAGYSQNRWIEDKEMMFKISVPQNYQTNQYREGTDKIHAFVSRDNNVAVSIRSFKLPSGVTVDQLVTAFAQNVLKGANQLVIQPHSLNGSSGKMAGYRWRYNNINVVVGAYYTINNNIGYVVWSMIPENIFSQRSAESDAITNSFTVLNPEVEIKDSGSILYDPLISEDARIEHLIPKGATVRNQEPGQTIWNIPNPNGEKPLTMVIQNVVKEGKNLNSFMNEQVASIRKNGATLLGQSFEKSGAFYVCRYSYEYNGTRFYYTAVDGPVTFYLTGFVGGVSYASLLEEMHSTVSSSFKSVASQVTPTAKGLLIDNITINTGTGITPGLEISGSTSTFTAGTKEIHSLFAYRGDPGNNNFTVKWFSKTHNSPVAEAQYQPKAKGQNRVHSFIDNSGENWPAGEYQVELWFKGEKLAQKGFSVINEDKASPKVAAAGEIRQIVLDNKNIGYDFATGKIRTDHTPDPDVLNEPWCTALPALCGNWAKTGKSRLEDVTSPPASGYTSDGKDYIDCVEAPLKEVLVFKLKNGEYAKLMIIKDEFTKSNNVCQHKITCFVEYPAFK